jgi:hypothetical protein
VWSTDNNGNYIANIIGTVTGANSSLQAIEPVFSAGFKWRRDGGHSGWRYSAFDSDWEPCLESYGATALNQVDNRYYLYDSNGSGPSLKYLGATYFRVRRSKLGTVCCGEDHHGYDVA